MHLRPVLLDPVIAGDAAIAVTVCGPATGPSTQIAPVRPSVFVAAVAGTTDPALAAKPTS